MNHENGRHAGWQRERLEKHNFCSFPSSFKLTVDLRDRQTNEKGEEEIVAERDVTRLDGCPHPLEDSSHPQ